MISILPPAINNGVTVNPISGFKPSCCTPPIVTLPSTNVVPSGMTSWKNTSVTGIIPTFEISTVYVNTSPTAPAATSTVFVAVTSPGGGNGIVTTVVLLEFVVVTGGCKGFNKKVAIADAVFNTAPRVDGAITVTWNVTVKDVPAAILGSGKPTFGSNPGCGVPFIVTLFATNVVSGAIGSMKETFVAVTVPLLRMTTEYV